MMLKAHSITFQSRRLSVCFGTIHKQNYISLLRTAEQETIHRYLFRFVHSDFSGIPQLQQDVGVEMQRLAVMGGKLSGRLILIGRHIPEVVVLFDLLLQNSVMIQKSFCASHSVHLSCIVICSNII